MKQLKEDLCALLYLAAIIFAIFCLFSCSTVKKEYLEENYAKKENLEYLGQNLSKSFNSEISKIRTDVSKIETSVSKNETKQVKETEIKETNHSTTVSGRIVAEAGMNKSVSFGNTTITANGADVEFTTSSNQSESKELTSEFESKIERLEKSYYELFQISEELEEQNQKLNTQLINQTSTIEELKKSKSKKKTIRSLPFMLWLIIGGVLAFSIGLNWLNRFTILGKIKKIKSNINPYT